MKPKKSLLIIIVEALLVILSGCGTKFVYVTSEPPGALVKNTQNTDSIRTPDVIELDRWKSAVLTARLAGYWPKRKAVDVVIWPPSNWRRLSSQRVHFKMEKKYGTVD